MNKSLRIIIAVLVVVLVGGFVFWQGSQSSADTGALATTTVNGTDTASTTTDTGSDITAAIVATHNSESSCWTIIDGNVYDLTNWIPQHPGGAQAILSLCGHDGSSAFHAQHYDAKQQADILATFKIGELSQ